MGANLITSLQEIRDFRASQGRRYPVQADFTVSCDRDNQWMPKLLCIGRFWSATLSGSKRETRTNGNSPAIGYHLSSHLTKARFSSFGTAV